MGFIKVRFDPSTRYKDSLHQLWCRMLIQLLSYYWCCVVFTTRPESWPSADTTTQFIIIGVIIGVGFATVCPDQAYCLVILNQLSRYIKQAVYSQTNHNSVPWQTIDSVDIFLENFIVFIYSERFYNFFHSTFLCSTAILNIAPCFQPIYVKSIVRSHLGLRKSIVNVHHKDLL